MGPKDTRVSVRRYVYLSSYLPSEHGLRNFLCQQDKVQNEHAPRISAVIAQWQESADPIVMGPHQIADLTSHPERKRCRGAASDDRKP